MSFSDNRFPTDISYGISGGPQFDTEIVETHSGAEYRNIRTPYGRNKYNIASGIKTKAKLDEVINFFRAVKGRAIGFRFKDWLDYGVENQFIGSGDGVTKTYQLIKIYSLGTNMEVRKITKPVRGTVEILINDKKTRLYKIDWDNGIIIFPKPLRKNTIITGSFEFDVPVRFNTDHISASIENYGVHAIDNIDLVELI